MDDFTKSFITIKISSMANWHSTLTIEKKKRKLNFFKNVLIIENQYKIWPTKQIFILMALLTNKTLDIGEQKTLAICLQKISIVPKTLFSVM